MRWKASAFVCTAAIGVGLISAASAQAARTVCSSGCPHKTIQGAIEGANPGETITIAAGAYYEDVKVTKAVTLRGAGSATVIYPAISQPVCPEATEGSLCDGRASVIIEVAASNVKIERLSLNGNNPNLTSAYVKEGQMIDARDAIDEDYEADERFNDLTVVHVSISNIWERGVDASSEGTGFNFNHDTINNVQGEEESIAIFNYGASGEITHDTITNAEDGIAGNWSTGTKIEYNKVSKSPSGIHTDNNGGFGGTADVLKHNEVTDCPSEGYGIFTFASRVETPTVEDNRVKGCYVAFAAYGSEGLSGVDVKFADNRASGAGASTNSPEGPFGVVLSTSLLGYGAGPMDASLTGNTLEHFGVGLYVEQHEGNQATVTATDNQFDEVTLGAYGETGTVVKAENNWWGCKQGPNQGGKCAKVEGTPTYTPWLTSR